MFSKWVVLVLGVCCLVYLVRGESAESSSDYEDEEKDEFADMKNDKDFKRDKTMGRSRDPFLKGRDGEDDEFAGMEEEFQNDKDFLNMKDDEKSSGKDKEDIEFQLAFGEDDSKEKNEKDEFYQVGVFFLLVWLSKVALLFYFHRSLNTRR